MISSRFSVPDDSLSPTGLERATASTPGTDAVGQETSTQHGDAAGKPHAGAHMLALAAINRPERSRSDPDGRAMPRLADTSPRSVSTPIVCRAGCRQSMRFRYRPRRHWLPQRRRSRHRKAGGTERRKRLVSAIEAFLHPQQGEPRALANRVDGFLAPYEVAGVLGGRVFTAATEEVRTSKGDNKKSMSGLRIDRETFQSLETRWTFEAGKRRTDKRVGLRTSAGYRSHVHSRSDELKLTAKAVLHGVTSGPVGVTNLTLVKRELKKTRASLRAALDALSGLQLARRTPVNHRARTISAMKDELYDCHDVRRHLGIESLGCLSAA